MEEKASKPLLILGVLVLLVVASGFIPAKWFGIKPIVHTVKPLDLSPIENIGALNADTNKDGVSDWKTLLNTTYSASTTTPPTQTPAQSVVITKRLNDPNNLTSDFSKNLYVASAYMKQNNITDQNSQADVVNSIIAQEKAKIVVKTYTAKDLVILKTDNDTIKKTYGDALGALITKAVSYKMGDDDLQIIKNFTTKKDPSILSPLGVKKDELATIIQALIKMPVPPSATAYHILALNRISEYYTVLSDLSTADTDPIRANISLNDYIPTLRSLFGALNNFRQYFSDAHISFSKDEAGYYFTNLPTSQ